MPGRRKGPPHDKTDWSLDGRGVDNVMLHGVLHGWLRKTEDCPPHLRVRRRVVQRSEQMLAVVVLVSSIDHGLVEQWST